MGVFLKEQEGVVFFLESRETKLLKLGQEKFTYTNGWENLTEDLDEVLYRMELKLKKAPEKTIFFVYSHLVEKHTGQIKREFLKKIREVSKNLELKPLGYIECHQAVLNRLQKKQSLSLTALMLEFDRSYLQVFLYKGGKLEYEESLSRSANLIEDLLPVLDRVRQESVLPARLILYNSKDLDLEITKILSHRWEANHFVQLPKIEVISEDELFEGLIDIFAYQLFSPKADIKEEEKKEEEDLISPDTGKLDQIRKPIWEAQEFLGRTLSKAQSLFTDFKKLFLNLNLPLKFFIPIGALGLVVFIILLTELFFHKGELTIFLPHQSVESKLTTEVESARISKKTATLDLQVAQSTTGKREVGEKAKGGVTVHNFDDKEAIFKEGTALVAGSLKFLLDNDVKVASASLAPDGSAKLPGKGTVKVTAEEIGPEQNITKNQRFEIENLSSLTYFAINDEAFTGGTKKQVRTVSKSDIENLTKKANAQAQKHLESKILPKINNNHELLKQLSQIKLAGSNFSYFLGEEADALELKTKANITYFLLGKDDLLKEFMKDLDKKIKKGYKVKKENIVYKIEDVKEEGKVYTIETEIKARASQEVKEEDLLKKIAGKSEAKVEELIREEYKSKIDFKISNPLPFLKNRFPLRKGNIQLKISYL